LWHWSGNGVDMHHAHVKGEVVRALIKFAHACNIVWHVWLLLNNVV
jgi:hypothetical protein